MDKYEQMAVTILEKVGGKENVENALHCMTRLRLNLRNMNDINVEEMKKIEDVLGCQYVSGQLQVIIGPGKVNKVYDYFCKHAGITEKAAIDENVDGNDAKKEKFKINSRKSWANLGNKIMDGIIGCMTPILPILIAAGLIKMLVAILGPAMTGVITAESDLYRLLDFVGGAGFYFLPVFIGYTGAKKFGASPILGVMIGTILIHPTLLEIVAATKSFTVFGIPMSKVTYSSTVLPMILITWALGYVERFIKKICPDTLATMLVPTLTVLIMLPISLCALGPVGAVLGIYLSKALIWIHVVTGPFGVALIGSLFLLIVATGMHPTLIAIALSSIGTVGYDDTVLVGSICATYACIAIGLAVFLKAKDKQTKQIAFSTTVSQALGGVGEPLLYGVILRYKRLIVIEMIATFVGTLWVGFNHGAVYFLGSNNFLVATVFGKGIINGIIGCAISFVAAFIPIMVLGFGEEKQESVDVE